MNNWWNIPRTSRTLNQKKNLVEGLNLLHDTVNKKYGATEDTVDKLPKFSGELTSGNRNFEKDSNLAMVKIEGDKGEIKALGKQLDAIQDAMNKDIHLMAGGVVIKISGVATMIVATPLIFTTTPRILLPSGGYPCSWHLE